MDEACVARMHAEFRQELTELMTRHHLCLADCLDPSPSPFAERGSLACRRDQECPASDSDCTRNRCMGSCVLMATEPDGNRCSSSGEAGHCAGGRCTPMEGWAAQCARLVARRAAESWHAIGGLIRGGCTRSPACREENRRLRPQRLQDLGAELIHCLQGDVSPREQRARLPRDHHDPLPFPERGAR
jgi:hypothetical protein